MYICCNNSFHVFIQTELEELATAEARSKVEKFLATENSIVTKPVDAFSRTTEGTICVVFLYLCASLGRHCFITPCYACSARFIIYLSVYIGLGCSGTTCYKVMNDANSNCVRETILWCETSHIFTDLSMYVDKIRHQMLHEG